MEILDMFLQSKKWLKGIRTRVRDFIANKKTKPTTAVDCKGVKLASRNLGRTCRTLNDLQSKISFKQLTLKCWDKNVELWWSVTFTTKLNN